MTMPDRIWVYENGQGDIRVMDGPASPYPGMMSEDEYIRADLVPQWQTIETAPDYGVRFMGAYKTKSGEWVCEVAAWERALVTSGDKVFPATHWMPLPEPPHA